MQLEKKTKIHKIFKRKDGRYAVTTLKGEPVNGEDKTALLLEAGLVTAPEPKPEPEPEEVAEEATEAAAEAPADEEPSAEEEEPSAEEEPAAEEKSEDTPADEESEEK